MDHPPLPPQLAPSARPFASGEAPWVPASAPCSSTDAETEYALQPLPAQERAVARAVLLAQLGVRGPLACATPTGSGVEWELAPFVDRGTAAFCKPLLDMAADRAVVYRFGRSLCDGFEHGYVNMAVGAAMVAACDALGERVCAAWRSADSAATTALGVARTALLPHRGAMAGLRVVADAHGGRSGPAVLRLLEDVAGAGGDAAAAAALLLQRGAVPYFDALADWVAEGTLAPGSELGIDDSAEDMWQWRWTVTADDLPQRLLCGAADAALRCGQLARLLRSCDAPLPDVRRLAFTPSDPAAHAVAIRESEAALNAAVLAALRPRLLLQLSACHSYLLCGDGVWLQSFLDRVSAVSVCGLDCRPQDLRWGAAHEPDGTGCTFRIAPARELLVRTMRRLLSRKRADAVRDPVPPAPPSDAVSAITVVAELPWPLSLVLGWEETAAEYEVLCRVVLRVKVLLHQLVRNRLPRSANRSRAAAPYSALHSRAVSFLRGLEHTLVLEVIAANFRKLRVAVSAATTVAEVIDAHRDCMRRSLDGALAGAVTLYKKLESVFVSIKLFSSHARSVVLPSVSERGGLTEQVAEQLSTLSQQFDLRMRELLLHLGEQCKDQGSDRVRALMRRIDWNGYYQRLGYYDGAER
eukprot:TRINITY_DN19308_c0_g1_i1.p1 TRINITY_DN19308_c0_g1~~TRINITY_DN19308_c0_g1_i1.p1  ORF type:complete len:640 (+),score=280.51 TRINITY_DN19308_c0_g1_i1:58-1977(+)